MILIGLFFFASSRVIDFGSLRTDVQKIVAAIIPKPPCADPITYTIGTFDTRFGITREEFAKDIVQGGVIWEQAAGRTLFQNTPNGAITINLIYDSRQMITDQLRRQGIAIDDDKANYTAATARYESLLATYTKQKAAYEQAVRSFNADQATYEQQVKYWNAHGGAPKQQYNDLQAQSAALDARVVALRAEQAALNATIDQLNATLLIVNGLAQKLNLKVNVYNTLGASNGEEFSEGEYVSDASGIRINVYQFSTKDRLIRLLEHELGHALGMDHVVDPRSILYRLNSSSNMIPTNDDLAELAKTCWK